MIGGGPPNGAVHGAPGRSREVALELGDVRLPGTLTVPDAAVGVVVFAHGSGSGRLSPRNRAVAAALQQRRLATLLFDLLLQDEDAGGPGARFDIDLLTRRLQGAVGWLDAHGGVDGGVGLFGASTGAAAALATAAAMPSAVAAVVSRGGRPDLAMPYLDAVRAPTLLIVGGNDRQVLELNRTALARLTCVKEVQIVPGAGHLFEERGALERVASLAGGWFLQHLQAPDAAGG